MATSKKKTEKDKKDDTKSASKESTSVKKTAKADKSTSKSSGKSTTKKTTASKDQKTVAKSTKKKSAKKTDKPAKKKSSTKVNKSGDKSTKEKSSTKEAKSAEKTSKKTSSTKEAKSAEKTSKKTSSTKDAKSVADDSQKSSSTKKDKSVEKTTKKDAPSKEKEKKKPEQDEIAKEEMHKKKSTKKKAKVVTAETASAAVQSSYEPDHTESTQRLTQLAQFLSGEKKLKDQESEIENLKNEAIEMQKDLMRKDIAAGEVVLESPPNHVTEDILTTGGARRVVQKIKLYDWKSPIRVQFPFDAKLFAGIVVLSLIFVLYLAVLGQYGLMFCIIALLFFLYVAGTTDPMIIEHVITTRGVETLDKTYEWYMLDRFWFSEKNGEYVLLVETRLRSPSRLIMLVEEKDITPIFILLQDKLLYMDVRKQGRLNRMTYGEYIPIEKI